jgi:hypothetical protein
MINKYRSKPITVEAIQLTPESFSECCYFLGNKVERASRQPNDCTIELDSGECVHENFYIVKINGNFYVIPEDSFHGSYVQKGKRVSKKKEGVAV